MLLNHDSLCFTATEKYPFFQDWHLEFSKSLPTNYDVEEMALFFERNVYKKRGFHRVKGQDPPDWNAFLSFSSRPDFSDLADVLILDDEEIAKFGHLDDGLILQCTFNEQNCNIR